MRRLVLPLLVVCLELGPAVAHAQAQAYLEVDAADRSLAIEAWVGEPEERSVRLWARGADVGNFDVRVGDLVSADARVERGNVEFVAGKSRRIAVGDYDDAKLRIGGIPKAGTYAGTLLFEPAAQTAEHSQVAIRIEVRNRPQLVRVGSGPIVAKRVADPGRLAGLLLPHWETDPSLRVLLRNDGVEPIDVAVSPIGVAGVDSQTVHPLECTLGSENAPSLDAGELAALQCTLPKDLGPGRYSGEARVMAAGLENPIEAAIDLSVRVGPRPVLFALLIGVLLGRLFKYMSEGGSELATRLSRLNRLVARASERHADDNDILLPMIEQLRQRVVDGDASDFDAAYTQIQKRATVLAQTRRIEAMLGDIDPDSPQLALIPPIRRHVQLGEDAKAEAALNRLKTALEQAGAPAAATPMLRNTLQRAAQTAQEAATPEPDHVGTARSFLAGLAGLSAEVRAEATLWVARPLLYGVLVVGLLAVGLQTLYVEAGAALGAYPLGDYTGLVLWGLSSDVASRTLSNLRPGS